MNLSHEQMKALQDGEAVPITVERTDCVLVRKDIYERSKNATDYDDSEWSEEEMETLAAETLEQVDDCLKAALSLSAT